MTACLTAPIVDVSKFNGDPLKYFFFVKAFQDNVEKVILDDAARLTRLIQSCTGEARDLIESCVASANTYAKARELLRKMFGDPYVISQAWINKITIKPNNGKGLQKLSDNRTSCQETQEALRYTSEMNTQGNLAKVVAKLPSCDLHHLSCIKNKANKICLKICELTYLFLQEISFPPVIVV